jgi:hypothetical protein
MKKRLLVPQNQDQTQKRYEGGRQKPRSKLGNGSGTTDVERENHYTPSPAELPTCICGPGVAAENIPRIPFSEHFEQEDGEIDGSGEIGCHAE